MSSGRNAETGPARVAPAPEMVPQAVLQAIGRVAGSLGRANLTGEALAAAVAEVSRRYTRARGELADSSGAGEALCARLRFFLPRDLPKIEAPMAELVRAGALLPSPTLRVLDLGSGLGATALGAARYAVRAGLCERVEVTAVDQDARALQLGQSLAAELATLESLDLRWRSHTGSLEAGLALCQAPVSDTPVSDTPVSDTPVSDAPVSDAPVSDTPVSGAPAGADSHDTRPHLILLGFVLNELAEGRVPREAVALQADLLRRLTARLAPGGALIVLEPALRTQSRMLSQVRDALISSGDGPHLFAPCLHSGACPMLERERDWCHELLPLALPAETAALAREAGLRDEHLTFSYLTLRREPGSLAALAALRPSTAQLPPTARPPSDRFTAEAAGAQPVGDAVAYRIVSGPLRSKGKLELLLCDEGPLRRMRRLDRHRSAGNLPLESLGRGSVVRAVGAAPRGARLEVLADTEVEVLQSVADSDPAAT